MTEGQFVQRLLRAYLALPDTGPRARPHDRQLARTLHRAGIPLDRALAAMALGTYRRNHRAPGSPPLLPVRSLAYFQPILEEIRNASDDYVAYLLRATRERPPAPPPRSIHPNDQNPALSDER